MTKYLWIKLYLAFLLKVQSVADFKWSSFHCQEVLLNDAWLPALMHVFTDTHHSKNLRSRFLQIDDINFKDWEDWNLIKIVALFIFLLADLYKGKTQWTFS